VTIAAADGQPGLGREVVASGNAGASGYACYAVGWRVINQQGWTGYFIKTTITPGSGGAFKTSNLQLGSDGETTSSWWPFLLAGRASGCAWLDQLWTSSALGEYHGTFPPPGIKVLYDAPAPIHRTR
jgi:hypothetical protein